MGYLIHGSHCDWLPCIVSSSVSRIRLVRLLRLPELSCCLGLGRLHLGAVDACPNPEATRCEGQSYDALSYGLDPSDHSRHFQDLFSPVFAAILARIGAVRAIRDMHSCMALACTCN